MSIDFSSILDLQKTSYSESQRKVNFTQADVQGLWNNLRNNDYKIPRFKELSLVKHSLKYFRLYLCSKSGVKKRSTLIFFTLKKSVRKISKAYLIFRFSISYLLATNALLKIRAGVLPNLTQIIWDFFFVSNFYLERKISKYNIIVIIWIKIALIAWVNLSSSEIFTCEFVMWKCNHSYSWKFHAHEMWCFHM